MDIKLDGKEQMCTLFALSFPPLHDLDLFKRVQLITLLRVSKYAALLQKPEALEFLGKRHKAQQQKYNKPRHLL